MNEDSYQTRILTTSGKLWRFLNERHGSSTWGPAGDLIVKIEDETKLRIVDSLKELAEEPNSYEFSIEDIIEYIEGQEEL